MSIPDYQSLMLPVLEASSNGEVRIGEVAEELAEKLRLSQEERSQLLPSGKQTVFSNRVHWAKSYLSKAHLVEITRSRDVDISGSHHAGKKLSRVSLRILTTDSSCNLRSSVSSGRDRARQTNQIAGPLPQTERIKSRLLTN